MNEISKIEELIENKDELELINIDKVNDISEKYLTINTDWKWKIPIKNQKKELINYALVDEKDYQEVIKHNWSCRKKQYSDYYLVQGTKNMINLSHFIYGKQKKIWLLTILITIHLIIVILILRNLHIKQMHKIKKKQQKKL
jgi:hypothetical protein